MALTEWKCFLCLYALIAACSDLEKPLPRWRRQLVEFSSESCCRVVLFCMGFWRPKLICYENYKKGQEMGAVGVLQLFCRYQQWT